MSALARQTVAPANTDHDRHFDLTEIFRFHCDTTAAWVKIGGIDLLTAVDTLQHSADSNGVLAKIGQDAVQEIMSTAFSRIRS
jgi:hypothetical protein